MANQQQCLYQSIKFHRLGLVQCIVEVQLITEKLEVRVEMLNSAHETVQIWSEHQTTYLKVSTREEGLIHSNAALH